MNLLRTLRHFPIPSLLFVLALVLSASAQSPQLQMSHTAEDLRGVSVVSRQIAWASGTHGTYLRTNDGGRNWTPAQVPEAATLDFRGVIAFSADEAFLMSSGPGDQSRIYHTSDAGKHWQLQFKNTNSKGFFDSIAFWDPTHGIVLGDPVADEAGKLKFELLQTNDGQTWRPIPWSRLPEALPGEGAFAASNGCIALLGDPWKSGPSEPALSERSESKGPRQTPNNERALAPVGSDRNIWFATGGKVARVFHSADRGETWQVFDTPIQQGPDSTGIFSIAFRDPLHGVIAGGDYKRPKADGPNLALTKDGGKTWTLSQIHPQAYFSAVTYDLRVNRTAIGQHTGHGDKKVRIRRTTPERLFIIAPDFVFDFRPPSDPTRINGQKGTGFNAASPDVEGGALIVGPKGAIASIP